MFYLTSGSIYNSMKLTSLRLKWQQKKENPDLLKRKQEEDPEIRRMKETAERVRKSNLLSALDGKLKAGGELTSSELDYLRANNPELYQEAVKIKQERMAYKKQLSKCRTKEEVDKVKMSKLQQFVSETKAIAGNPNIPEGKKKELMEKVFRRVMGVQNEHQKFVKTKEYQELPEEEEIKRKEKKEKKKAESAEETGTSDSEPLSDDMMKKLDELFQDSSESGNELQEEAEGLGDGKGQDALESAGFNTGGADFSELPGSRIYTGKGEVAPAVPSPGAESMTTLQA